MDPSFPERSPLQVEDVLELLDNCLTTTYYQFEDQFYHQKEVMAMRNLLSPVVSNIFMEHFEEITLYTADRKPAKWLKYVNTLHGLSTWTSKIIAISSSSQRR
jgi:hypothetical protein